MGFDAGWGFDLRTPYYMERLPESDSLVNDQVLREIRNNQKAMLALPSTTQSNLSIFL